jgi:dTDP-L-rhamnose 4-epimerase
MLERENRPLVLITGGAGFIGTNLAKRLATENYRVRVLDPLIAQVHGEEPATTSALLREVSEVAEVQVGSVTSRDQVERAIEGASVIVHYAAETGTGQSMYEIERYVSTNVGGTALLLDVLANREHAVEKVVVASSRSIYGEGKYLNSAGDAVYPGPRADADMAAGRFEVQPTDGDELRLVATDECSHVHPSSVYGITKQTQEQLVMTVCPTIGIAPVALRYQNVYGPGQSLSNPYTGILSIFSSRIRQGQPINIFEDGAESRDFIFITDVVEATFQAIAQENANGKVFNVGSGVPTSVREVVNQLMRTIGREVPVEVTGNYRLGDIRHNFADLALIADELGFAPQVAFESGVGQFVEWVKTQPIPQAAYTQSLDEMRRKKLLK